MEDWKERYLQIEESEFIKQGRDKLRKRKICESCHKNESIVTLDPSGHILFTMGRGEPMAVCKKCFDRMSATCADWRPLWYAQQEYESVGKE
jgi:hypothetical protein